jgi:hypothetical protein
VISPSGQISRAGDLPVQPHFLKYSHSRFTQIKSISSAVPPHRGAYRDRHGRGAGCGGRGQRVTNGADADGEVVWSYGRSAGLGQRRPKQISVGGGEGDVDDENVVQRSLGHRDLPLCIGELPTKCELGFRRKGLSQAAEIQLAVRRQPVYNAALRCFR